MYYRIRYQDDDIIKKIQDFEEETLVIAKAILGDDKIDEMIFKIVRKGYIKDLTVHKDYTDELDGIMEKSVVKEVLVYEEPKPLWDKLLP